MHSRVSKFEHYETNLVGRVSSGSLEAPRQIAIDGLADRYVMNLPPFCEVFLLYFSMNSMIYLQSQSHGCCPKKTDKNFV